MGRNNGYNLITKAEVKSRLASDFTFQCEACLVLFQRQTIDEQCLACPLWKNLVGFNSSDAPRLTPIAKQLLLGLALTDDQAAELDIRIQKYSRQMAAHLRGIQMAEDESLREVAARFGL